MCRQQHVACLNRRRCGRVTQGEQFLPCGLPDCYITHDRVPRDALSQAYCEECRAELVHQWRNRMREGRKRAQEDSKKPNGQEILQPAASLTMGGRAGSKRPASDQFFGLDDGKEDYSSPCSGDDSPCAKFVAARKRRRMGGGRDADNRIVHSLIKDGRHETIFPASKSGQQLQTVSGDEKVLDPTPEGFSSTFSSPSVTYYRYPVSRDAEVVSDDEAIFNPASKETTPIFPSPPIPHGPRQNGPVFYSLLPPPPVCNFHPKISRTPSPELPPPPMVPTLTGPELSWWHNQPETPCPPSSAPSRTVTEILASANAKLDAIEARQAESARNGPRLDDPQTPTPAAPEISVDSALLHVDAHLSQNEDPMENLREADEFLRTLGYGDK